VTTDKTNLVSLLKAAADLPADRRRQIEPPMDAREKAAEKITAATEALMAAFQELYEASAELSTALQLQGIEGVPPARIQPGTLTYAVGAELWRIGHKGKPAGSPLRLPCHCLAPVVRPDLLPPLVDLIKEANNRVRMRLT
jgi:hypothetical protein